VSSTSPKLSNTAVWIVTAGREKAGDSRFRGDIQVTQAHLKAFGFDSGTGDGIFTAQTRAAVRAFQARYGTQVSRLLDRDTREELDSGLNRKRTQSGGLGVPLWRR
jgi:peptidoglycan hydrolase-like protein with peptidoglycan-binding domain